MVSCRICFFFFFLGGILWQHVYPISKTDFSKNIVIKDITESVHTFGFAGYSHKPEEYSSIENISNGVKVLALTLAKLSRG